MVSSDYRIQKVEYNTVYFVDLNLGNMSVTNDAEQVVEELHKQYPNHRLVYKDSGGIWDELLHDEGEFKGFAAVKSPE